MNSDDKDNYMRLLYQHVETILRSIDRKFLDKIRSIFDIIADTNTRFVIDDIDF